LYGAGVEIGAIGAACIAGQREHIGSLNHYIMPDADGRFWNVHLPVSVMVRKCRESSAIVRLPPRFFGVMPDKAVEPPGQAAAVN
jgi:hypothetical protein